MRASFCELLYLRIYCIENDFAILGLLKVKILLLFSEYVYNMYNFRSLVLLLKLS